MASPALDQVLGLKAGIEAKVPDVVSTGFNSALAQVSSVAASLDAKLSSGIDNLVEKMPALKEATPALYESTRQSVRNYATFAATYLASFTLAHVFLKAKVLEEATLVGALVEIFGVGLASFFSKAGNDDDASDDDQVESPVDQVEAPVGQVEAPVGQV